MTGRIGRAWLIGVGMWLGGCVLEVPDEPEGPDPSCNGMQCSSNGYCREGACFCDSGFLGNAYAQHGCQSTRPAGSCSTTCGLNSYCETGACVCDDGFIAVCGTGDCLALRQLCDGIPDCPNSADEAPQTCAQGSIQQWTLDDACDDGLDVSWRLWSRDRDWAWPGPDATFVTDGFGRSSHEEVDCLKGESVCFGAEAGERSWGVGIDGEASCEDCCFLCSDEPVDLGTLGCE